MLQLEYTKYWPFLFNQNKKKTVDFFYYINEKKKIETQQQQFCGNYCLVIIMSRGTKLKLQFEKKLLVNKFKFVVSFKNLV